MGNQDEILRQGSIVWIEVPDPRGNLKRRPVVVVTATHEIVLDAPIVGVAVSTRVSKPPRNVEVSMPWSPMGHPATRLRRECAAVADWLVRFKASDVRSVEGYVPQRTLLRILGCLTRKSDQ